MLWSIYICTQGRRLAYMSTKTNMAMAILINSTLRKKSYNKIKLMCCAALCAMQKIYIIRFGIHITFSSPQPPPPPTPHFFRYGALVPLYMCILYKMIARTSISATKFLDHTLVLKKHYTYNKVCTYTSCAVIVVVALL